jgi:hypothetical protein
MVGIPITDAPRKRIPCLNTSRASNKAAAHGFRFAPPVRPTTFAIKVGNKPTKEYIVTKFNFNGSQGSVFFNFPGAD